MKDYSEPIKLVEQPMKEEITVRQSSNPDQFIVENNHNELEGGFLENYIAFSGYFGKHGPYVFAAGPDLVEALQDAIECGMVPKSSASDGGAVRHAQQVKVADKIRAALAKARGET